MYFDIPINKNAPKKCLTFWGQSSNEINVKMNPSHKKLVRRIHFNHGLWSSVIPHKHYIHLSYKYPY